jgi:hypothetical protein
MICQTHQWVAVFIQQKLWILVFGRGHLQV